MEKQRGERTKRIFYPDRRNFKGYFRFDAFGIQKSKGLKSQNLRDHMNDLELIFSMLGEASTTAIVRTQNPKGFIENQKVARQGGAVAGKARKDLEAKTGQKVVSSENYLPNTPKRKQISKGKKK